MLCHLWSQYQIGLRENLEQSQRRSNKLVRNIKYKSYEERLPTLNLISTLNRQDIGDMIMTYDILNHRVEMDADLWKWIQRAEQEDIPWNSKKPI